MTQVKMKCIQTSETDNLTSNFLSGTFVKYTYFTENTI